ncbi:MAG: Holliday junction branch migration protein RuvA [Dehalococcoidales bacterium]|jgi:Holliday junction DNA helicase RuvA|nr:Holliday junction branch migration protein RuvA [Dehalococcoidales bacterium]MDD3994466.1 Holliday junction branch migration protein RuvA [Dehalococcoidales bacterium]NLT28795.1 Holliday junction branch migration protein RuvA [Dehalococcoidales bacterium]
MIASLNGKLEALGSDWAIINVGGVGFQVYLSTTGISNLGAVGSSVKVYTHLNVREDNLSLFGFSSTAELELFKSITSVSGIGPKLALAMLSAMEPDQLIMAIASGNADLLTGIPGVGKKTASRIVLELKDKIGTGMLATPVAEIAQENADVLAALTSLGYSTSEVARALSSLPRDASLSIEDRIKLALGYFEQK